MDSFQGEKDKSCVDLRELSSSQINKLDPFRCSLYPYILVNKVMCPLVMSRRVLFALPEHLYLIKFVSPPPVIHHYYSVFF